nr:Rossmann-like and DUF2520 domain-containing protein [uncultured Peptostreptococcus sp.]
MYNIGFVGAGKVGVSLGIYISDIDYIKIQGYYSRTKDSSIYAASLTDSKNFSNIEELVKKSNVIIISSPDDEIRKVWEIISKFSIQNKIVCHCSGSLSSEIFFDASSKGASVCSIHPILAISSKENSYKDLYQAFFTIEGQDKAVEFFSSVLKSKKNKYKVLSSREKTKYHISSVFISNLIIAMGNISIKLLGEYNFSQEEALAALKSLAMGNVDKLFTLGSQDALTGPVERNDLGTVENHLKALEKDKYKNIDSMYRLLSLELVDIAKEKNKDRDYNRMENLLLKGSNPQVED